MVLLFESNKGFTQMKRILIIAAILMNSVVMGHAAEKKAIDVGTCGEMWRTHKASPQYTDPGKGKRMEAWLEFRRAKCSKNRKDEA